MRLRTSTVEGLSNTASFCIETRIEGAAASGSAAAPLKETTAAGSSGAVNPRESVSLLGW